MSPTRNTANRASRLVMLVAAGTLAAGLAGCGSSKADASGKITGKTSATSPCSKTPTTDHPVAGVALQNWNQTCDAPAILSAYRTFLATYDEVWNDPFGNGMTPTQELGQIYQQVQNGTYPQTSLPPGCTLPPPAATPQALPPACQPLVTSTTTTGPLAWATTQLSKVATPVAVSSIVQSLANYVGQGTPKGQLSDLGYAVVRQYATSGSVRASVPNPNIPNYWDAWKATSAPTDRTNKLPVAFIWSCVNDSTEIVGSNGQPTAGTTATAGPDGYGALLAKQGPTWLVADTTQNPLNHPTKSGNPCGAGF